MYIYIFGLRKQQLTQKQNSRPTRLQKKRISRDRRRNTHDNGISSIPHRFRLPSASAAPTPLETSIASQARASITYYRKRLMVDFTLI
jgi:hypothetical protein